MYKFGPFQRGLALVEGLPGDGLPYLHLERLSHILIHLVDQEQHGEIERQETVGEIGQTIEELRVLSAEVDGHYVALIFHAFHHESLRPGNVANHAVALARTDACRLHQHVVVALETGFHHLGEITSLMSRFINRNTERGQSWKIHQQVVDQITETAVVMPTDNSA